MSENTENTIDIDPAEISKYIQQYQNADSCEERRAIENQVLGATVWQTNPERQEDTLELDEEEIKSIYKSLPENAKEARRLLRAHHLKKL